MWHEKPRSLGSHSLEARSFLDSFLWRGWGRIEKRLIFPLLSWRIGVHRNLLYLFGQFI